MALASPCLSSASSCLSRIHRASTSRHSSARLPAIRCFTAHKYPPNSPLCDPALSSSNAGNDSWHWLPQEGLRAALTWTLTSLFCFGGIPGLEDWEFRAIIENFSGVGVAHAGLALMPPERLNNSYYLVRSGESEFEKMGIINTNPVAKTNIDSGLSENGKKQAVKAALQLQEMGACEGSCWIWPSITQRAYQAAEIIAVVNKVNRSRIVPEYSFLDARGLGAYEGRSLSFLSEVHEADSESSNLRPPPFTDGTPNESVSDVFVRITQLMSILETQYFGESIIIVAPDSDNLSVLQAALTGLDLRRHSMLSFLPGEVRHVDLQSISVPRTRLSGLITCPNPPKCN